MILVDSKPQSEPLNLSEKQTQEIEAYLNVEIEDALAARKTQESLWNDCLHSYEAPADEVLQHVIIEGVKKLEVPLGAIATDSLFANVLDLIYVVSPIVTAQSVKERDVDAVKSLQAFINWGTQKSFNLRAASENAIFDDVQLGTGVYYIPWVKNTKKTKTHHITASGPRIYSIPPEDFLIPAGARDDIQLMSWNAARFYLSAGDLKLRGKMLGWDIERAQQTGNVGWVRSKREQLGRTQTEAMSQNKLYEIFDVYCLYDIDGDGIEEDLLVTFDKTSGKALKVDYNPFDQRPFVGMRYQLRSHLFYGLGVMEMMKPFQDETTEIHQQRNINMLIANTRMWKSKVGTLGGTLSVWPNRVVQMTDMDSLQELRLGDVYPSSAQAEAAVIALAERRTGVNDMSLPRPSQVLGSRTPGITAMTLLQQANRRFTPAFDSIRFGTAEAVKHCLYRYQERLLADDQTAINLISKVMGEERAGDIIQLLSDPDFDDSITVQLTASSGQLNRETERQNNIMLIQVLKGYHDQVMQLAAIANSPEAPQPLKEVAIQVAKAATEVIERTLRTFDQVRDSSTFLVELNEAIDQVQGTPQGMQGLDAVFQQLAMQEAAEGGGIPPAAASL